MEYTNETLEEAADKANGYKLYAKDTKAPIFNEGFIAGANYQAERMYSEKDMAEAFIACWKANVSDGIECKVSFNEWIKQFKKK